MKIRGHSAVGEDGASLSEAAAVQQVMLKFANAYLDNVTPKTEAEFERFHVHL